MLGLRMLKVGTDLMLRRFPSLIALFAQLVALLAPAIFVHCVDRLGVVRLELIGQNCHCCHSESQASAEAQATNSNPAPSHHCHGDRCAGQHCHHDHSATAAVEKTTIVSASLCAFQAAGCGCHHSLLESTVCTTSSWENSSDDQRITTSALSGESSHRMSGEVLETGLQRSPFDLAPLSRVRPMTTVVLRL